jgi:outer membrane immunogenic protein
MKASIKLGRPVAAAFGLAALFAIPAQAADAIFEQPPAPPAVPVEVAPLNTWSGPYAGVTLGYGFSSETSVEGPGGLPGVDVDTDGFTAHGFAGWNGQSGAFVYGVEGDVGYNGVEGEDDGVEVESGVDGSLRTRLGYAVTDNVLLYGTAGGAAKRTEVSDVTGSDTDTMLGYTVGAGVDTKLTENVFGRLEYRYSDYGSETFNTGSGDREVESRENRIGVGLGIKF